MKYTSTELKDFDTRLETYYKKPKSAGLIREALQFLRDNPDPRQAVEMYFLSPFFLKRLTKTVASLPEPPAEILSNPHDLEIAIEYCTVGAALVESVSGAYCSSRLRSHFLGHAAKLQTLLAALCPQREEKCLESAIALYDGSIAAADPSDCHYVASRQVERARCLVQRARRDSSASSNGMLLAASAALHAAGTNIRRHDGVKAGMQYTLASEMFFDVAKATPTENRAVLLERAVKLGEEGASLVRETLPEHYATTLANTARYARELWKLTDDSCWQRKAIVFYRAAILSLPSQQEELRRALQFQEGELRRIVKRSTSQGERKQSTRRLRTPPPVPLGNRLQDFLDDE